MTATATEKPRRRRNPELVRESILQAANQAFALHGFEGATLPKIAASAGVGTPLIIHYFKSKRLLWEAVLARISSRARTEIEAIAVAGGRASDRLRQMIRFQVEFFAKSPEIYQLLASEAHHRSDRLRWICDNFGRFAFDAVVGTIRAAQAEGAIRPLSPERLRYVIIGVASIAAVSAEYEALTGQDPCTPGQLAETVAFLESLIFVDGALPPAP